MKNRKIEKSFLIAVEMDYYFLLNKRETGWLKKET